MDNCDHPQLKQLAILSGTSKAGRAGPLLGLHDIGVCEDSYLCRVALVGIRKDESNLSCKIQRDGSVHIQGMAAPEGEIVKEKKGVIRLRAQQLCPPGPFTISFKLPGPVDPRLFFANLRADGILELVVMKHKERIIPVNGFHPAPA